MRVIIVAQRKGRERLTWSGIPFYLGRALGELGVDVGHLQADPPRPILRASVLALRAAGVRQPGASHGPELAALRSLCVARRARGEEDARFVVTSTGFSLPEGLRYVTFQDLTVAQALGVGWSDPALMGARPAQAWRARERRICRGAAACCTASDWTARSIVDDYDVPAERVRTVGFGTNVVPSRSERDWSVPRFLFIGREWERKNGDAVLDAFRKLRRERPEATLTLVSDHDSVSEPGVDDVGSLSFASQAARETLKALYERSTCFVLPSKMEPFGIAYLEAAAAGVPSIGTRVGGAPTAVGDGGVLVDPDDEDQLLAAMRELTDPARARELGARAVEHAANFTWTRVAERVLETLETRLP